MERSVWTDERLDDMAARNEQQFDRLWTEMRETRSEMHAGFDSLRRDMFHGAIAIFGSQVAILAVLVAQAL